MPRYTVGFSTAARQMLRRLDGSVRKRIVVRIEALEEEPRPSGCKKLSGGDDLWRIRVGDHRVVYSIEDAELVVLVVRVGHRREVYR
jgi:mRNA interferase RelE/StbE